MKKVFTAGIMAAFVSMTLTGCDSEDKVQVLSARNVDECVSAGMDFLYCTSQYQKAEAMHVEVAPKFETASACGTEFGESCVQQTVTNSDGTTSNVWLPMMMGYMMGNMSSNINDVASPRPLYMTGAKRDKDGAMTGRIVTASGNAASFGSHSLSRATATAAPKAATVSSTRAAVSSRGGFGSSARGGSAAS